MENIQAAHFETMHDLYADHYYDAESTLYRKRFIYDVLFDQLNANHTLVGDICCGDGYNSLRLREYFPEVQVEGFDISPTAVGVYHSITRSPGHVIDLIRPLRPEFHNRYDIIMCIGGIHHCVQDLGMVVKNIAAMLKPGGRFVCMEPYASPLLNPIRKLWYKLDPYFNAATERALTPNELATHDMHLTRVHFGGGPAFYLVCNSMIFRLPKPIKRIITPPLLAVEALYNRIMPRVLKAFFVAEYLKQ